MQEKLENNVREGNQNKESFVPLFLGKKTFWNWTFGTGLQHC